MRTTSQRATPVRWWMLLILSLCIVELTLNWFNIAAAFPPLGQQFHLQIPQLAVLIALFIAGYAVLHIPAGLLAYRIGLKNTLLLGLLLESLGSIATAFAPSYGWLQVLRFLTGAGGSFVIGSALAMVTSWFRGRELALAMGIAGGCAFTLGQALGIFCWLGVIQATGWSTALIIGGVSGLVVCVLALIFLRVPSEEAERLASGDFSWSAVGRVLGNRDLWFLGLSFFGTYGVGLTAAQLLTTYVGVVYHLPEAIGGLMSLVLVLMAIPGSLIGGYFADRVRSLKSVIVLPWVIMGLTFIIFPFLGVAGVWMMVLIVGACQIAGFAAWTAAPGHYRDRLFPEDIATAEGLMLTIAGIGGFIIPVFFGQIASGGFTGAWIFAGIVSIVFALIGFAAREPLKVGASANLESVSIAAAASQKADATL
jgi:ACS family D-galactonate transporter-like MFS transporter